MWWKIYFWIQFITTLITVLVILPNISDISIVLGVILNIAILIGTYSFVYKKMIGVSHIWKAFLILAVFFWTFGIIYTLSDNFRQMFGDSEAININSKIYEIVGVLLNLPAFYAIYRISFKKS